ncbi:MAG: VCBS repeat-containing protein [Planctomycetaceae bacterium]|nr:VCBS repeat-containing protein [Planctomycetales bacterium]MCB9921109.1 VCBS repeat-containing protein [Planctomycetaceae bacterium]
MEKLSGHEKMRVCLAEIAHEASEVNGFVGDRDARRFRQYLNSPGVLSSLSPEELWKLHYESGRVELRLGNEERALTLLNRALDLVPEHNTSLRKRTQFELGIAYLRYGETQNCCQMNSSESCIVPIRGAGIHQRPEGSRNSIEHFMEVLKHPAPPGHSDEMLELDEAARWLMNIAYMTIGEYPDGVPERYRVSPDFFKAEAEFPRFPNVYPKLKLNTFNLCGGAVVDDFDNDGDLDIVTCTWDVRGQTQVFRNNSDGSFDEVTNEVGLQGFYGGLNLNHADYDNDGDLDIFIMRGAWLGENGMHPNSLLRNDGGLRFTDVTFELGLGEESFPTKTSAWADFDNDGDLDLYVGNESSDSVSAPCQLFRQESDGTFVDVARRAGLADARFSMGAAWGDYNNDRYPDLYISFVGENKLYRNNQDGTFTNVASDVGVEGPSASFPTWFWDYDNDGFLDIFVGCTSGTVGVLDSDIRFEMMCLYRNKSDGTFEDVAKQLGLHYPAQPMGANFGDLDSDGFPDFYLATGNTGFSEICPNVMFHNQAGKTFDNVTMSGGFGHLQKGHGVSFADIDNDGDQDVYVQLGGAYAGDRFSDALFENPGFANHSITLKLEGTVSNRSAIGVRIRIDVDDAGTNRTIFHQISGGSSFGENPYRQAIGIGKATLINRLEVFWPTSGTTQTFNEVAPDKGYLVIEGSKELHPLPLTPFVLGTTEN